jgi:flavodoxin
MYDKKLILYYSESGNTKKLAEMIQAAVGGDMTDIKDPKPDFSAYDLIFIGTPNHAATMAKPVKEFIDGADWTGCTVAPFCTHGMGGLQNVGDDITAACKGAKKVFPALPVKGVDVDAAGDKLKDWLASLGL